MSFNTSFSCLILFSLILVLILDSADLTAPKSCPRECGVVHIPYPFGIGEGCYLEKWYEIECVNNISVSGNFVPFLSVIGKEVVSISPPSSHFHRPYLVRDGSVHIKNQITSKGCSSDGEELGSLLNLTDTPFYVTPKNTLVAVGCNNTASLTNIEPSIVGCTSSCNTRAHTATEDYLSLLYCQSSYDGNCVDNRILGGCNGTGCCMATMPQRIQQVVGVKIDNTMEAGRCRVAFLTIKGYSFSHGFASSEKLLAKRYSTVELGWVIHTANRSFVKSVGCYNMKEYKKLKVEETFMINCVCDTNSDFTYARCSCARGYQGNPYIPGECKDINECVQKDIDGRLMSNCDRGKTCVNTRGSYDCVYGYNRPLAIGTGFAVVGSSFGSLLFIGGIFFLYKFIKKQRRLIQKKKFFKRNGGLLLQQQLTSTEGNVERTRVFTSRELEKATENFSLNRILGQGGQGTVYKGMLVDGSIVAVKKSKVVDEDKLEEFINEVVILSQINHRNIVKLLGCCLETDVPVLVYEFIPNGNLFEHLHDDFDDNAMFTWEVRLRIAVDVAGALSYLHSSASSPVYHRDVKSTNIMLDEKYRAKVSDFGTSRSVTVDHTHLTTVVSGTVGYMDPEFFQTSQFTDKSDVYSFGVVLVELITAEKSISFLRSLENRTLATYFISAMKENRLLDIIDARIRDSCKVNQVTATAKIARKCLNLKGRKRPSMREVSMELEKIHSSSGDMQLLEYVNENEVESWKNMSVTAPASQYNATTSSFSSSSDIEPLFPLQTR